MKKIFLSVILMILIGSLVYAADSTAKHRKGKKEAVKPVSQEDITAAKKKLEALGIPLYKGAVLESTTGNDKKYKLIYSVPAKNRTVFESMAAFYKTELPKTFFKNGWKENKLATEYMWTYSKGSDQLKIEFSPPSGAEYTGKQKISFEFVRK